MVRLMKRLGNILKEDKIIALFPEGTRNKTEELLLPFKYGAVRLAKETNSKIIPFAIRDRYILFKRSVKIEFGEPIDVTGMEVKAANEYLKNAVKELLKKGKDNV